MCGFTAKVNYVLVGEGGNNGSTVCVNYHMQPNVSVVEVTGDKYNVEHVRGSRVILCESDIFTEVWFRAALLGCDIVSLGNLSLTLGRNTKHSA